MTKTSSLALLILLPLFAASALGQPLPLAEIVNLTTASPSTLVSDGLRDAFDGYARVGGFGDLTLIRRIDTLESTQTYRVLDRFVNNTSSPISTQISYSTNLGSDGDEFIVDEGVFRSITFEDRRSPFGTPVGDFDPVLAFTFGNNAFTTSNAFGDIRSGSYTNGFDITVAPGEAIGLLQFATLIADTNDRSGDVALATSRSDDLLLRPNLVGLGTADIGSILNFDFANPAPIVIDPRGVGAADVRNNGVLLTNPVSSPLALTGSLDIGSASAAGSLSLGTGGAVTADSTVIGARGELLLEGGTLTTGSFDNSNGGAANFNGGELIIDGGQLQQDPTTAFTVGAGSVGQTARLTLDNGATFNATAGADVIVGDSSQGELVVTNGSSMTQTLGGVLRVGAGSDGVVTVSNNGTLSINNRIDLGETSGSMATLNITSGGSVSSGGSLVGEAAGSTAVATIDGAGSTWINSGNLVVGSEGNGTLTISDGGSAFSRFGNIASQVGSTGTVRVTDATWTISDFLTVGVQDAGALVINQGGVVTNTQGRIAAAAGADGLVIVDGAGSTWTNSSQLFVGNAANGTLSISNGGTVTSVDAADIGVLSGSTGDVTLDGAGSTLTTTGSLTAGRHGVGTLEITNGAVVTSGAAGVFGNIGLNPGSNGSVTVAGLGSAWTHASGLFVGNGGRGTLVIEAGGQVTNTRSGVGNSSGGTGVVIVDGDDSAWMNSGELAVGALGNGTLTIRNGGSVSNTSSRIGSNGAAVGAVTVTGAGSTWTNSIGMTVGIAGEGILSIADGGVVSTTTASIASNTGSSGSVTVSGAGSTWTSSGFLGVGGSGDGTLTIQDGGAVTSNSGSIGVNSGSLGVVQVDGAGSTWTNSGNLTVGNRDVGLFSVTDGAVVSNAQAEIGANASGFGEVFIDGVGSTWTNSGSLYLGGSATAAGGTGTLEVQNGAEVTVAGETRLWGPGDRLVIDGGRLTTGSFSNTGIILPDFRSGPGELDFRDGELVVDGGTFNNGGRDLLLDGARAGTNPTLTFRNGATGTNFMDLDVADDQIATVNILEGSVVISAPTFNSQLGGDAGSTGVVNVSGAGSTWFNRGELIVGQEGGGTLNIVDGGAVTTGDEIILGHVDIADDPGSTGAVNVSGLGSAWTVNGVLDVGRFGVGALTIGDRAAVSSFSTNIGEGQNSAGSVSLDNATWTVDGTALVGYMGNGSLSITNGGTLSSTQEGAIGTLAGSIGAVTVDGSGSSWTMTDDFAVGFGGDGRLTISGGGQVSNVLAEIGSDEGVSGNVTVTGAGSRWVSSGFLTVGDAGSGSLLVDQGGEVRSVALDIATASSGVGQARIQGAGSTVTVDTSVNVGYMGSGSLIIEGGAVVSQLGSEVPLRSNNSNIAPFQGSNGAVTVTGAGSRWEVSDNLSVGGQSFIDFMSGELLFEVGGDGVLIVQDGGEVNVGSNLGVLAPGRVELVAGTIHTQSINLVGSLSGFGAVNGTVTGSGNINVYGGVLTLSGGAAATLDDYSGAIAVAPNGTLEVNGVGPAELGTSTTLNGGALLARNGVRLGVGDILRGYGIVVGEVTGPGNNQLAAIPTGTVDFRGTLDVGADTATIYSQGRPTINGTLSFTGGNLVTPTNELFVGGSGVIEGNGDLTGAGRFTGALGSTLRAIGSIAVGDAISADGFYSNGRIEVGEVLTLADANEAVLDSGAFVQLGSLGSLDPNPSTLVAGNGLLLDFGGNIEGTGVIDTPDNAATPFINNGNITGDSLASPITLTGYIKGVGTLDNVIITGTDAPGFSPAAVNRGSVEYAGTLEIEVGGTTTGRFDQVNHILGEGDAILGGELVVSLTGGYTPAAGDTLEFLTASGDLGGAFDTETFPQFDNGLFFEVLYSESSALLVVGGVEGDYNFDGVVNTADYTVWRDGLGSLYTRADYDTWLENFGLTAFSPSTAAISFSATISSAATIPEPGTLLLTVVGLAPLLRRRA